MFEKVLFPTDFSDVSKKALNYVKSLKSAGAKKIIVLRVINERKIECICQGAAWCGVEASEFVRQAYQNLTEEAQKELRPIESELKAAGFDVRVMVAKGVPQTKILEVAEEEGATSIVLGSHGRGNLSTALLGSVSGYVIQHSKIPVVVIKRDSIDGAD